MPGERSTSPATGWPMPPSPRTGDDAIDSARAAQLRAVQDSDRDHEALRQWELQGAVGDEQVRDRSVAAVHRPVAPGWRRRYTAIVVVADLVVAGSAAAAGSTVVGEHVGDRAGGWSSAVFAVLFVVALTLGRVYEHRFVGHGFEEYRRLATGGVSLIAVTSTVAYAFGLQARAVVLFGAPVAAVAAIAVHFLARQALFQLWVVGRCRQRVVVIGLERSVAELARTLQRDGRSGLDVVAACVSRSSGADIEGVPVLGSASDAVTVLRRCGADTVLLTAWSDVSHEELRRLSWDLEGSGVRLLVAPRLSEVAVPRMHLQTVGGMPLLSIDEPEFTGLRRVAKSGLDYGIGLLALVLAAPIMVAVAVAVKVSSPGPVLFRQERIGKGSKPFRMTKFRSMYLDAESRLESVLGANQHGSGPLFKLRDDPRITPVGRIIRRFSLDELPQIFDVLSRKMSLVGPRPPLPREVAGYEEDARRRLLVKPGITGLWQVSGRSDLTWEQTVRLDLSYVENWSLGLDLSIIARTVVAVLARRGAY